MSGVESDNEYDEEEYNEEYEDEESMNDDDIDIEKESNESCDELWPSSPVLNVISAQEPEEQPAAPTTLALSAVSDCANVQAPYGTSSEEYAEEDQGQECEEIAPGMDEMAKATEPDGSRIGLDCTPELGNELKKYAEEDQGQECEEIAPGMDEMAKATEPDGSRIGLDCTPELGNEAIPSDEEIERVRIQAQTLLLQAEFEGTLRDKFVQAKEEISDADRDDGAAAQVMESLGSVPESHQSSEESPGVSRPISAGSLQIPGFPGSQVSPKIRRRPRPERFSNRSSMVASRGQPVSMRAPSPEEPKVEAIPEAGTPEEEEVSDDAPAEEVVVEVQVEEPPRERTPPVKKPRPQTIIAKSMLSPAPGQVASLLWNFEGKESREDVQARLRTNCTKRRGEVMKEADRFLNMMKEKGGGSVTQAWRRYFDSDGDGELSFIEFCNALADLKYEVDTVQLWQQFGGGGQKQLSLEVIDPKGAEVLEYFAQWCKERLGGPIEVFRAMDSDGSDSLEPDEFVDGLRELGFFEEEKRPEYLQTEDQVLNFLFPLLDQGAGCVQAEQMLFLEQDRKKRVLQTRELQRLRDFGNDGFSAVEAQKDAEKMLHQTAMGTTQLGGTFWKMIPENNQIGSPRASWAGSKMGTPSSLRSPSASSHAGFRVSSSTPKASLFPRNDRYAGCLQDAHMYITNMQDGVMSGLSPSSQSTSASALPAGIPTVSAPRLESSMSLPSLPGIVGKQRQLAAVKQNNAQIRRRSTQKLRGARNIYGGSLVAALPSVDKEQQLMSKSLSEIQGWQRQPQAGHGTGKFDPLTSCSMDFFRACKSRGLFDHYHRSMLKS
jgi:hypothetical protein